MHFQLSLFISSEEFLNGMRGGFHHFCGVAYAWFKSVHFTSATISRWG